MSQTTLELIMATGLGDGFVGILSWVAILGTILLAVAWTLATLARRRSAAVRHLIWSLGLVALLALPLAAALPGPSIPLLPARAAQRAAQLPEPSRQAAPTAASPETTSPTAASPSDHVAPSVAGTPGGAAAARPEPRGPSRWSATGVIGVVYGVGVVLALLPLAIGLVSARRFARSTVPMEAEPKWAELLRGLRRRLGITRPVSLRRAAGLTVPVTWGWRRPVVMFPDEAEEWSAAERHNALVHEIAHVARGDWAVQLAARVACAIHWFHPLVWLAARRVAAEAERACDDRVLLSGAEGADYADQLVVLARRAHHGWAANCAAIAMARPSALARRVAALLDERTERAVLRRRTVIVATAVGLLPWLAIAPARVVRAAGGGANASPREVLRATGGQGDARSLAGPDATPPMRAAAAGDRAEVERLLVAGAAPDRVVPRQGTALILAAVTGTEDVVAALLEHGADANLADPAGNRWAFLPRTALNGAARTGGKEVILALTTVLGDENAFVRRAAVNSLMDLGATREASIQRALRPLLGDPDRGVRHAAEAALGLRERVRSNPLWDRRTTPVQQRPIAELLEALDSADSKQRVAALDALGNIGNSTVTDTVGPILHLLADANEIVRQRAAAALGNIGSGRAVAGLIVALGDSDEQVRQAAGESLGAIGDARALDALTAATGDRDEHVRQAAVSALGQIGDPRAVSTVVAKLKDPDEHVRQVAAGALGRLGG